MKKKVGFTVFGNDIEAWQKIKVKILARQGKLKGKLGRGIIALALKGLEYEKKEKNPSIKNPKFSPTRGRKLLEIYKKLPNKGNFSEELIYKILYSMNLFSPPTRRNYLILLEGSGMIWQHHSEVDPQNPRRTTKYYEKGKINELSNWIKGWIKEEEEKSFR